MEVRKAFKDGKILSPKTCLYWDATGIKILVIGNFESGSVPKIFVEDAEETPRGLKASIFGRFRSVCILDDIQYETKSGNFKDICDHLMASVEGNSFEELLKGFCPRWLGVELWDDNFNPDEKNIETEVKSCLTHGFDHNIRDTLFSNEEIKNATAYVFGIAKDRSAKLKNNPNFFSFPVKPGELSNFFSNIEKNELSFQDGLEFYKNGALKHLGVYRDNLGWLIQRIGKEKARKLHSIGYFGNGEGLARNILEKICSFTKEDLISFVKKEENSDRDRHMGQYIGPASYWEEYSFDSKKMCEMMGLEWDEYPQDLLSFDAKSEEELFLLLKEKQGMAKEILNIL